MLDIILILILEHHFSIIEESNNPVTRLFPLEFTQNKIFDAKLAVEEAKRLYNVTSSFLFYSFRYLLINKYIFIFRSEI